MSMAEQSPGWKDPEDRDANSIAVLITRIRKKIGHGTIETVRGTHGNNDGGYRLTETGLALVRAAMGEPS